MNIYRVKTYYHLMLSLLLVNSNEKNFLIIDGLELFDLTDRLNDSGLFSRIVVNTCSFEKYTTIRRIRTLFYSIMFTIIRVFSYKEMTIYTPQHNFCGVLLYYFSKSKNIYLLEDGEYSYKEIINGNVNSLFSRNIIRRCFKSYFLTIYNPLITGFLYRDRNRLMQTLPNQYNIMKDRLIDFNVNKEISLLTANKENAIHNIFLKDVTFHRSEKKLLILLTQPLCERNILGCDEIISLYDQFLCPFVGEYEMYIKEHPAEVCGKYSGLISKYHLKTINSKLPFELLSMLNIKFDLGVTYNSTAVHSEIILNRVIIDGSS